MKTAYQTEKLYRHRCRSEWTKVWESVLVLIKVYCSPPWPCRCTSASPWAPAQPTSQPGSWWPPGCPGEGVPAAPETGGVCRRGERHSLAGEPAAHLSPPPLPLLCLRIAPGIPGPHCTAPAADNTCINSHVFIIAAHSCDELTDLHHTQDL